MVAEKTSFERLRSKIEKAHSEFDAVTAEDQGDVQFLSTGVRALDRICNGGLPWGRIVEVYGPYSSGKTLLCQSAIVQLQKMTDVPGIPFFVDREKSWTKDFTERQGIDNSRLFYDRKRKTVEDIFDYTMSMFQRVREQDPEAYILGAVDSIAAANTRKELARDKKMRDEEDLPAWDKDMGHRAKMIGEACRKVTGIMDERMMLIIVNQTRSKVGQTFGNPETTTGGQALPFYASLRIRLSQGVLKKYGHERLVLGNGKGVIGTRAVAYVSKSKVGPPLRRCEIVQSFEFGFLEWPGLYECLLDEGVIELVPRKKKGKGERQPEAFTYAGGEEEIPVKHFRQWIEEHPEVLVTDPATVALSEGDLAAEVDEVAEG